KRGNPPTAIFSTGNPRKRTACAALGREAAAERAVLAPEADADACGAGRALFGCQCDSESPCEFSLRDQRAAVAAHQCADTECTGKHHAEGDTCGHCARRNPRPAGPRGLLAPDSAQPRHPWRREILLCGHWRIPHGAFQPLRYLLLDNRHEGRLQPRGELLLLLNISCELGIARDLRCHAPGFVRREFAVDKGHQGFGRYGHDSASSGLPAPKTRVDRASRARASRLVTVPIGTSRIAAA